MAKRGGKVTQITTTVTDKNRADYGKTTTTFYGTTKTGQSVASSQQSYNSDGDRAIVEAGLAAGQSTDTIFKTESGQGFSAAPEVIRQQQVRYNEYAATQRSSVTPFSYQKKPYSEGGIPRRAYDRVSQINQPSFTKPQETKVNQGAYSVAPSSMAYRRVSMINQPSFTTPSISINQREQTNKITRGYNAASRINAPSFTKPTNRNINEGTFSFSAKPSKYNSSNTLFGVPLGVEEFSKRARAVEQREKSFYNSQALKSVDDTNKFLAEKVTGEKSGLLFDTANSVIGSGTGIYPFVTGTIPLTLGKFGAFVEAGFYPETRKLREKEYTRAAGEVAPIYSQPSTYTSALALGLLPGVSGYLKKTGYVPQGTSVIKVQSLDIPIKPVSSRSTIKILPKGENYNIKTIGLEVGSRSQTLVSFTPEGIKFGNLKLNTRIPINELKSGLPMPEGSLKSKVLLKALELTPQETTRASSFIKAARILGKDKGLKVKEFTANIEGLKNPSKAASLVEGVSAREGGVLFGSATTKQLPSGFQTLKPGDIDIIFPKKTVAEIAPILKDLTKQLRLSGENVRMSKDNVIEFSKTKQKFLEAKSGINQEVLGLGDEAPVGIFGFRFPNLKTGNVGATVPFGKTRAITAGEQFLRKGAGSFILSTGETGKTAAFSEVGILGRQGSNPRGLKDVTGMIQSGKGLAEIRKTSTNPFTRARGIKANKEIDNIYKSYTREQQIDISKQLKETTGKALNIELVSKNIKNTRSGNSFYKGIIKYKTSSSPSYVSPIKSSLSSYSGFKSPSSISNFSPSKLPSSFKSPSKFFSPSKLPSSFSSFKSPGSPVSSFSGFKSPISPFKSPGSPYSPIPNPPSSPIVLNPGLFSLGGGGGSRGGGFSFGRKTKISYNYTPSIEAALFKIKGKAPGKRGIESGLVFRPLRRL